MAPKGKQAARRGAAKAKNLAKEGDHTTPLTQKIDIFEVADNRERRRNLCVLEAKLGDTIGHVKELIQEIEGVMPEKQLIFQPINRTYVHVCRIELNNLS